MRSRHLPVFLSIAVAAALLAKPASAQTSNWNGNKINGVPASVTSFGFGGQPGFHGMPASVTSLNFGNVPNANSWRPPRIDTGRGQHHHNTGFTNPFYGGTYYVPYAYPVYVMEPPYDTTEQPVVQPAPADEPDTAAALRHELESLRSTVREYRDELRATRITEQPVPAPTPEPEQAAANQPETVLVFKDGHQSQVVNYAIVGSTLYDLSEGRSKKVALAELDLPATVKQNDERGVEFRIPAAETSN